MAELARHMNSVVALIVCASMLTGFLVLVPEDAEAQGLEGWIIGNVKDESSNPVEAYLVVMLAMSGGNPSEVLWTDAGGNFNVTVYAGLQYILLAGNGSYYMNTTVATSVANEAVWANITLTPIAPVVADVVINGRVTDEDGTPLTGGTIMGITNDPANMGEGMPIYGNATQPDPSGWYSVNVIPGEAGGGVAGFNFVGYDTAMNGTEERLESGKTYWINLTLRRPVVTDDATVSGHIYDNSTGDPLPNATIQYSSSNMWNEDTGYSNLTFTDAPGFYEMNVTNGSARIWFSREGYSMSMIEDIRVNPGDNLVFDVQLVPTVSTIRGNVTDEESGLGVRLARVIAMDSLGHIAMAFTDSSGSYTLETFQGEGISVFAEADSYSRNWTVVDIAPGETLWINFTVRPADAWMNGTVVDKISRAPIADSELRMDSEIYGDGTDSNSMGEYNFTALVSGEYELEVWADGYRSYSVAVTVVPGANEWHVELLPSDLPNTCRLFGWVNDSLSSNPIDHAQVKIGISPEDHSEHNQTYTDPSGYYEMWIPPIELLWVANVSDHAHANGSVDASGLTELELDVQLMPDMWGPNITMYSQVPLDNVSTVKPMMISIMIEEDDYRQAFLQQWMHWRSEGSVDSYYVIESMGKTTDPLEGGQMNLPIWTMGNLSMINYMWPAQTSAGWLSNSTESVYLSCWEQTQGPYTYEAIWGLYKNSSSPMWQPGAAVFDKYSGSLVILWLESVREPADLSDPTGLFAPAIQVADYDTGTGWFHWNGTQTMGEWELVGLMFTFTPTVPSGKYLTTFGIDDWGGGGNGSIQLFTVDTEAPRADAGPDQLVLVNTTVTLDGRNSTDNVGIVEYSWNYTDNYGSDVYLSGDVVTTSFNETGTYEVWLNVRDEGDHWSTDSVWITVSTDVVPPTADAGDDQEVDMHTLVVFDGSNSSDNVGIVNWTWTFYDGGNQTLWDANPSYTFHNAGTFDVVLTVYDDAGLAGTDTVRITVRDTEDPVADAGMGQTVYAGALVYFDASGSSDNVAIVNWTWTFTFNSVDYELWGENASFMFDFEPESVVVTLTVLDAENNSATDTMTVEVSGWIPEFPTVLVPVMGIAVFVVLLLRRRR